MNWEKIEDDLDQLNPLYEFEPGIRLRKIIFDVLFEISPGANGS